MLDIQYVILHQPLASHYQEITTFLNVRKISARWMPHLLTDGQTKQRVKIAKQLLKILPKFDEKKFANAVTGDETWANYFEPVRKVNNKIWATKKAIDQ